ncbi:MAG: hypothetical protein L0H53_04625 [Candidatus Nitrosocosmicus sp.]|nr:hypothetical protein [Candidatus Nitrosocosmicus sp.]
MKIISLNLSRKLLREIDLERGEIPRSRYVNRLLEDALKEKLISIGKDSRHSQ